MKQREFYNMSVGETEKQLSTDSTRGLSADEATRRRAESGWNEFTKTKHTTLAGKFFAQFKSFMIIVLIIAAGISGFIGSMEGEGFTVSNIDGVQRVVTLTLDEQTDIRNVRIDSVRLTDKATASRPLSGTFDMRSPIYVTLSLYQDYDWTIRAEQTVERSFNVAGQVGAADFDLKNHIATAYMPKGSDLSALTVEALKLGPADITTYSPTAEELTGTDFSTVRFVDVTAYGRTERWTLRVEANAPAVTLTEADAWSKVIWLYASGISGRQLGFRYRQAGTEEWLEVPDVTVNGGSFTARLSVEAQTSYEVKAYCGDDETEPQTLTTDEVMQLPNAGLEDWSQPKSPWLPYLSDTDGNPIDQFWDTGNKGSTTLGANSNVTSPSTDIRPGSTGKSSAQLASRYVAIKFAAGNLVAGEYAATRGTNGVINFGRPFTLRPTALRLWVKYTCGTVTDFNGVPIGTDLAMGDPDVGGVYIALGTWTKEKYGYGANHELFGTDASPVSIDTRDVSTFFDPKGPDVIGYGEKYYSENVDQWTQITIPITYRSTNERPTHIILVCASSRYGDWFTGSRDSKMWIDDVELIYE